MGAKMGRPISDNPKTERLFIRVTPDEKEKIYELCRRKGVTVLDLIRVGMEAVKEK